MGEEEKKEEIEKKRKVMEVEKKEKEEEEDSRESKVSPEEKEKVEWVRQMRLKFSAKTAPEMVNADGSLNKEYFKAKGKVKKKNWGETEKAALLKGIEEFGIGNWNDIREKCGLLKWEAQELRLKTAKLMGRQSIIAYKGWKGNAAAIQKQYNLNYKIGQELGCWKGGLLVADDNGKVLERIEQLEKELNSSSSGGGVDVDNTN